MKRNTLYYYFFILFLGITLSGCLEEELAFDIIESPVLAVFENMTPTAAENLSMEATFFELDKSGILDHTVGIDSMPIIGLEIEVFVNENEFVGTYVTDAEGKIAFEKPLSELNGASRLEWVGFYDETNFRIYKNF